MTVKSRFLSSGFFVFFFIVSFCIISGAWFFFRLYLTLPTLNQMQNIEQSLVSRVLGKDGNVVQEFSIERRFYIPIDKISPDLPAAVIAIEDRRFYKH